MRIIIFGANGFIGENIVKEFLDSDHDLFLASRHKNYHPNIPEDRKLLCDVNYPSSFVNIFKNVKDIDVCINLIGGQTPNKSSLSTKRINLDCAVFLYKICQKFNVKKFIQLSSASVYGKINTTSPLSETSPTQPVGVYAKSKLAADLFLISRLEQKNTTVPVILRLPLVYGPHVPTTFPRMIKSLSFSRYILFGSGNNKIQLLYIKNLTSIVKAVIENREIKGLYQLADSKEYRLKELLGILSNLIGGGNRYKTLPMLFLYLGYILDPIFNLVLGKKMIRYAAISFYKNNRIFDNSKIGQLVECEKYDDYITNFSETINSFNLNSQSVNKQ